MSNLDVLNRWIDGVNSRDLSVIDEVVGEHVIDHHLPPGIPAGREGVRQWVTMLCGSLQLHLEVQETVVDGDRIAVRAICSGTHVGDYLGFPATQPELRVRHALDRAIRERSGRRAMGASRQRGRDAAAHGVTYQRPRLTYSWPARFFADGASVGVSTTWNRRPVISSGTTRTNRCLGLASHGKSGKSAASKSWWRPVISTARPLMTTLQASPANVSSPSTSKATALPSTAPAQLGALGGAEHHGAVVDHVVDGEDVRAVRDRDREPSDHFRSEKRPALTGVEHLHAVLPVGVHRSCPSQYGARSSRFSTFIAPDSGSGSARNSTDFGTL